MPDLFDFDDSSGPDENLAHVLQSFARELDRMENDPGARRRVRGLMRLLRERSESTAQALDDLVLERLARLREGLDGASESQAALGELLARLTAPPLRFATLLDLAPAEGGAAPSGEGEARPRARRARAAHTDSGAEAVADAIRSAVVVHEGTRLVVALGEGLDPEGLSIGQEVLLSDNRNFIVGPSPFAPATGGDTGRFERLGPDGRLLLEDRGEKVLVRVAGDLDPAALRPGDLVRWDRRAWLAFESMARADESAFALEETPSETFADVGGLDAQISRLKRSMELHRFHGDVVRRYRMRPALAALLVGPPGTGKTLVARAFANWVAGLSDSGRSRFMNVKPGQPNSMWFGQTEARYRELFRIARDAGDAEPDVPVVLFFDEVDAVGAARGSGAHRVHDRVLTSFMAELSGFESRGNVFVIAATNRKEDLDPALLRPDRLGDRILEIPRPGREATVQILGRHLDPDIPYAVREPDADEDWSPETPAEARTRLIQLVASRIHAPNSEAPAARVMLRDGTERDIRGPDLVSGAVLANIARRAIEAACHREAAGGPSGLHAADLLESTDTELETALATLTPRNVGRFVGELPTDVDVVRITPTRERPVRAHRVLRIA